MIKVSHLVGVAEGAAGGSAIRTSNNFYFRKGSKMRYRIVTLAITVVAFLGTGAAMMAGSAQAATAGSGPLAHPATTSHGPYEFRLYEPGGADPNCIVTHGAGGQLTDSTSGCARITLNRDGTFDGLKVWQLAIGSGRCIRANNSHAVKLEGGNCNRTDSGEKWVVTGCTSFPNCTLNYGSKWRFENVRQLLWLKTSGDDPGDKVRVGTGGANDWDLYPS